jgi:hypothetical protein
MRNRLSKDYFLLAMWLSLSGLATQVVAAPEVASPEAIVMKSPDLFIINEREYNSTELLKGLKKNNITPASLLVIEVPAGTPMTAIKDLTQRLVTAGYKPSFKYPRHADASVKNPVAPVTASPPPKKQSWRK